MDITLYTTHCPKCSVLAKKLAQKGISYTECVDVDTMQSMGITAVPVLKVDNDIMNFSEANAWINEFGAWLDA